MKPRFYVLLSIVFLLIANTSSFAQDDAYGNDDDFESQTKESKKSGKKINSGYVFIDGKYIEPPYRFKVKNGNLFVNNKQACTEKSYNTIELKKKDIYRAGYPPCISEESDWTERNNCKIGNTNVTYNEMMKQYYLKNYKVEGAYDSLINYYRNYPNVISFEEFEELNGGVYKIICYNGNEILFQLDREKFIKRHSDENVDKNKNVDKTIKMYIEIFQDNLREECAIFFQSNRSLKEKSLITENELFAICSQDTLSNAIPEDVITSFTRNKVSVIKSVLEEYEGNDSFKKRLLKQQRTTVENSEEDVNDNRKKTFDLNNYSPQNNRFVAFFPIDYESGVSDMEEEIFSVKSKIENQGYSFIFTNYLFDQTANDDDLAYMPYSQLTELCADAGFLYVGSHGNINTLLIARALTPQGLEYWCNNDEDVYIVATDEDDYPDEWDHSNSLFAAIVSSNWINKYWKEDLENNNTISIISACKAHSGICEACAGGICFGYDEDTYLNDCLTNNANLLSLMNGQRKKSTYRNAIDAYDNIILYSGFNYIANSNITLCPATKDYFPANNALVPPGVTYGFFETDTWCDATIPANEALTFSVTGDINVNNVYWENNTNGKANKIAYEWSGTQGSVTVHVHTDKIVAYGGGGQKLDFDRKTPNGEANAYYIFRVGYGTNEVVDFNVNDYSIFANTTVDFTNTSTIENPLSYHWDFGDGYQSSEQNPSHTYTEPGVYDVSLYINTPVGMQYETKLAYISVYGSDIGSMACSAEVNSDRTITVYADISSSYADLISEYRFAIDFGNGDVEIVEGISNSVQVTYTYNDYGIYTPEVFADVFFSSGGETFSTGCVCNSVELYNPFPCNNFIVDFDISPNVAYLHGSNSIATVSFFNSTSGGNNYVWIWNFYPEIEHGFEPLEGLETEQYVQEFGHSGNTSKTYTQSGIYPVTLTVLDENGCSNSQTRNVIVS
ncbi:MAG: PKD domain-containing protein, partial [Bacteroidales bacterium]|nr:PKD domain-containing protein [Bacteroidales bacterium]